ncbi:MAG: hypothetical protein JWP97_2399, partial [Labilithrix sp.]|nr:hypothetical protein [Labilithrix sp.]
LSREEVSAAAPRAGPAAIARWPGRVRSPGGARWLAAGGALLVGGLLYLGGPRDPAAVSWAAHAGLVGFAHGVTELRHAVFAAVAAPAWLRGSASDLAYAFALGAIFSGTGARMLAAGLAFALAHEAGQAAGVFEGTFDVVDLCVLTAGFLGAAFLFRPRAPLVAGREHCS